MWVFSHTDVLKYHIVFNKHNLRILYLHRYGE